MVSRVKMICSRFTAEWLENKYCFCMLSEFANVFERKIWRVQVAHLHNEANLGKDFFRYLWYCGKKQIECGLTWHYWWLGSTDLGLINWHVFEQFECRNCCLYIIIQKIAAQAKSGTYFNYSFFPRLGGKWRRSEHAHASYPGLFFARPGSAPIRGGKKGEFRDWTKSGGKGQLEWKGCGRVGPPAVLITLDKVGR